jgi:hypothetical protein
LASLNYVNVRLLVDSGASFSCITESTFKRIVARDGNSRLKVAPLTDNIRLSSATGSPLHIIGEVMLDIRLQSHLIPQKFLVIRNLHHSGVIGMDLLKDCKAVINLSDQTLHLFDSSIVAPLITARDHANALCLMQTIRIPGHTEAILPVTLARHAPYRGHDPAITEAWPGITNRGIGIAKALVQPQNTRTICRILNVNSTPQTLRRGTRIAYLSPIDASDPFNVAALRGDQIRNAAYLAAIDAQQDSNKTTITQEDKIKAVNEVGLQLDAAKKRLEEHEFDELVSLLYEYKHLFITDDADIPLSTLPAVRIPLLDHRPVRIKPYKLPPLLDAELNRQLSKLCHSGILEPSCSPYSSPVFLVRKPRPPGAPPQTESETESETGSGNTWRIITDLRQINQRVAPLYHALPSVEDSMHKLGQAKANLYSVFDQKGAFFSLSLAEESRDLTAISSSKYHLRYTRLPLGLRSSSSIFQLSLSNLLRSQLDSDLMVLYQDDLFLFTNGWDQHKALMKQIFDRYDGANLRFNGKKSQVCCPRVQYLGYQFDETGVRISDARAQIIKTWPTPKNVKQVRSFLGSINYVKRLVPRHAELTFPLRELLRPDIEFKWGPEQQKSFDLIKQTLSSDTVLAYPRFDNLKDYYFIIICDGSKHSVGSALGQVQPDGSTRIIEYRARPTTKRESLGSATALELVSLIQAIRWHEPFLRLAPFVVKCDHVTLSYLRELKHSKNPKLLRYALMLSEFDYKIEYTKGRTHTLADSLSRRPFTQAERDQVEKSQQEVDPLFLSAISEELFQEMAPSDDQIWKSHSRHYRRHAKIMHLAPITVPTPASILDADQPQQQQPLSSTDDNSDTAPFPTVDDIMNATENLPPITLQTQRTDEYFAKIIDFLDLQLLPRDRQQARRTILIAESFQIVNNQLVKTAHFQRKRRAQYRPIVTQICAPKEWRLPILVQFHDFLNHSNSERCYYTIRDRFFWPNQFADVNNYVLSCEVCQKVRYRRQKEIPSGPSLAFSVMQAVHVDFFGPITPKDGQYSFVLILCDHSSQYLELCATKTTNAAETARCIYEKYYMRHGFVPNIISDRGQSFLANLTQELFKICKIRSIKTSGFHPT